MTQRPQPDQDTPPEPDAPADNAPQDAPPKQRARSFTRWIAAALALALAFGLGYALRGSPAAPAAQHDHATGKADAKQVWTCSMHPQIQSPDPGACPICGMDLIPLTDDPGGAPGPAQVRLTERAKTLARIQTTMVQPQGDWARELRLLGRLDYDETRTRTVTPWTGGRIDRLHVATTGQAVRRGQLVATLYSPEVYAAHSDLIQARKQLGRLDSATPMAQTAARATLEAARNRLRLLGITRAELRRMERADAPWQKIPIRTPFEGTIVERMVNEGQYVDAGTGLYRLVELSKLWVQLDAYERDLPLLSEGNPVELRFEALPGEVFKGTVAFIDPTIDPRKRTARVRVEVANDGRLRPGMFAEATARADRAPDARPPLLIPDSAPLFSGKRSLVYVEVERAEAPTYEAREVRLGPKMGRVYPVIAGLEYGERVVTHGAFRLDADLQLRGGESLMMRPDDRDLGAFDAIVDTDPASRTSLGPIVTAYLNAQEALAGDDLDRAKRAIAQLITTAEALEPLKPPPAQDAWQTIARTLLLHARVFAGTGSLDKARRAFEVVTAQIGAVLRTFGNPTQAPVRLAYCPMAFNNRGAEWFQRDATIQNAYFGASMLQCGEVRDTIDSGSFLAGPTSEPASAPASSPASAAASTPSSAPSATP